MNDNGLASPDNNLDLYFFNLSKHELLSKQEEIELGESIQAWKSKPKAGQSTRKRGKAALQKLVECNLRLVVKIAKDYRNYGLDLEDLVCEGNLGLLKAAERFDPAHGAKFSTYASYWIKQSIRRGLSNKSRTIRLPVGLIEQKNKVRLFIENYENIYHRSPSSQSICKHFNINTIKLSTILEADKSPLSIDSPPPTAFEQEARTLGDSLEDKSVLKPDTLAQIKANNEVLNKCLSKLTRRERAILEYRFGLKNKNYETLEKIGTRFRVTRERIRQIEEAALRKLRFHMKKYNIKKFEKI